MNSETFRAKMSERKFTSAKTEHDILYDFAQLYLSVSKTPHDYGNGDPMTMLEVHILAFIKDHPGATITQMAKNWNRTKSTLSEEVTKLERKGYLAKIADPRGRRTIPLALTESGLAVDELHRAYDQEKTAKTLRYLLTHHTGDEVFRFLSVLETLRQFYIDQG